jgi:hypothetical protein
MKRRLIEVPEPGWMDGWMDGWGIVVLDCILLDLI